MQHSRLPLVTWFGAIEQVLRRPAIRPAELAESIGVQRLATLRSLIQRIRAAAASRSADRLLAGLQNHFRTDI